jgi:plasmid stabilization system protein ParE
VEDVNTATGYTLVTASDAVGGRALFSVAQGRRGYTHPRSGLVSLDPDRSIFRHSHCTPSFMFKEASMARGDKSSYTDRQKRRAEHVEEGYENKGVSSEEAARRAWATVNKEEGGGKKSGSGRGKRPDLSSSRKGARKAARSRRASSGGSTSKTSSRSRSSEKK